jgi:hypothetical protein
VDLVAIAGVDAEVSSPGASLCSGWVPAARVLSDAILFKSWQKQTVTDEGPWLIEDSKISVNAVVLYVNLDKQWMA